MHDYCSSKRIEERKEIQEFVGVGQEKLLKHCPTSWLSSCSCIVRLIKQYDAIKSDLGSHKNVEKPRSKVQILYAILHDPTTLA